MPLCGVTCKQIKNSKLLCGFPQAMIEARCPTVPRGMAGKPPRAKGATAEAPGQLPLPGSWAAAEYAADCHFCGALSKKVEPCLGFTVPAKKSGACARVPRAFFIASASCFTFVNTPV